LNGFKGLKLISFIDFIKRWRVTAIPKDHNPLIPYFYPINRQAMSLFRVILSILFPPLAVIDQGCGSIVIVFLLTICGWVPGVIAALIILNRDRRRY
jgi:uncharacterized membrane protein YqaE (UPF0057 family)